MKFSLFGRDEKYIGTVKDIISATHTIELNGRDTLDIFTFTRLELGYRLIIHDKKHSEFFEFVVVDVEEADEGGKISYKAYCESSFYEIMFDFIEDSGGTNISARTALEHALAPTRWEIGEVEQFGIGSVSFYRTNSKEAIERILETWRCEIQTQIYPDFNTGKVARIVSLYKNRGKGTTKRLTYKTGMTSIVRKTIRVDVITALYGYGKNQVSESGEDLGHLDFSSINNGKSYVENIEAKDEWGRVNSDGTRSHRFGMILYDDIDDVTKLKRWAEEDLQKLSKPNISYEVRATDFSHTDTLNKERINLGDSLRVIDRAFTPPINHSPRVVKIVRDLINAENTEYTLGVKEEEESSIRVKLYEKIDKMTKVIPKSDDVSNPELDTYFQFNKDTKTIEKFYVSGRKNTLPEKYDVAIPTAIDGVAVESIGDYAFSQNEAYGLDIQSVTIPEGVVSIGNFAFANNLIKTLILPNGLIEVGHGAFMNNWIQNLYLPDTLKIIGNAAFYNNAIDNMIIPDGLTYLGESSFAQNQLTSFNIPSGLSKIESGTFSNNRIENIYIPEHITVVGASAFASQNSTPSISVGSKIIEDSAFSTNKRDLILRTGVEIIGHSAFRGGTIENLLIPDSVIEVGRSSFRDCNISSLSLSRNMTVISGYAFADNSIMDLNIPSSVEKIDELSFSNNEISRVNIPSSVNDITMNSFDGNPIVSVTMMREPEIRSQSDTLNGSYFWSQVTNETSYPATFTQNGLHWYPN